jgi:hypothetical protein
MAQAVIDFACWVTDEDPDDEDFIAAIEFFCLPGSNLSMQLESNP